MLLFSHDIVFFNFTIWPSVLKQEYLQITILIPWHWICRWNFIQAPKQKVMPKFNMLIQLSVLDIVTDQALIDCSSHDWSHKTPRSSLKPAVVNISAWLIRKRILYWKFKCQHNGILCKIYLLHHTFHASTNQYISRKKYLIFSSFYNFIRLTVVPLTNID